MVLVSIVKAVFSSGGVIERIIASGGISVSSSGSRYGHQVAGPARVRRLLVNNFSITSGQPPDIFASNIPHKTLTAKAGNGGPTNRRKRK